MSDVTTDPTPDPEPGPVDPPADDSNGEEDLPEPGARKESSEIADQIIAGHWGRGRARRARLEAAGYDPDKVLAKARERTVR